VGEQAVFGCLWESPSLWTSSDTRYKLPSTTIMLTSALAGGFSIASTACKCRFQRRASPLKRVAGFPASLFPPETNPHLDTRRFPDEL
jgi:hypothetical protein